MEHRRTRPDQTYPRRRPDPPPARPLRARRLLHYGQGKWYSGEPLPRWAFALYWRRDGKPIWRDAALIASETGLAAPSIDAAQRFTERVAVRLGITNDHVQPAFEIRQNGCSRKASSRKTSTPVIP